MKLFIPKLGTKLILLSDWTFTLHDEYRNEKFWKSVHGEPARESYFKGWDGASGNEEISPVRAAVCTYQKYKQANH